MQSKQFFVLGALLTLAAPFRAAGCTEPAPSLQPLFSENECEVITDLPGDWTGRDALSDEWKIQGLKNQKYRLLSKEADKETGERIAFDICAAHIDGRLFFDATSLLLKPDGQPVLVEDSLFWVPLHLLGKLEITESELEFQLLDDSWIQEQFESGRLQFNHVRYKDQGYLLTASSKELKEFATHFASVPGTFSCIEGLSRPRSESARPPGVRSEPAKPLDDSRVPSATVRRRRCVAALITLC